MSNTIQLKIEIDLANSSALLNLTRDNIEKLTHGVNTANKAGMSLGERFTESFTRIGFAIDGVKNLYGVFQGAIGGLVTSYQNQEAAQRKLEATSKLTGASYEMLKTTAAGAISTYALNTDQANNLTIALTKLGQKAGDVSQTSTAIGRLLDVAAAQGMGAEEALTAINQAILGIDEGTDKLFQKNPSVLYEEYAKKIGTTAGKLTDQQKAQALLNAVMTDGLKVQGEYSRYLDGSAGAAARMNAAVEQSKAQLGEMISVILTPAVRAVTDLAQAFNSLSPATKEAAAAIVGIGAVIYAFSSINIVGAVSSVAKFASSLTIVSGYAAGEFIVGIGSATVAVTALQLALGGIAVVLAVVGFAMYSHYRKSKELKDQEAEHIKKKNQEIIDDEISRYSKLSKTERDAEFKKNRSIVEKLKGEQYDLKLQNKSELLPEYKNINVGDTKIYSNPDALTAKGKANLILIQAADKDIAAYERRIKELGGVVATTTKELTEQQKKDAEELSQFRVDAMKDGYNKELAELNNKYEKEKTEHAEGSALRIAADSWYTAKKKELDAKYAEEEAKNTADHLKRIAEIDADGVKARIDNDEKIAMAAATTEAERLEITKRFAIERIEEEKKSALAIIKIDEEAASKITDPKEKKKVTQEITDRKTKVEQTATNATTTVNTTYTTGVENLRKTLSVETGNADIKAEQDKMVKLLSVENLTQKERQKIIEDSEKRITNIKEKAQIKNLEKERDAIKESMAAQKKAGTLTAEGENELLQKINAIEVQIGDVKVAQAVRGSQASTAEKDARLNAIESIIQSGMSQYNAEESLGIQMNRLTNEAIRRYIAEAVMEYIVSIVGGLGPLAIIAAPAAGLALQAALEAIVPKFSTGGPVTGSGGPTDDKIPAMLSNGEFVVNAKETAKALPLLNVINDYGINSPRAFNAMQSVINNSTFNKSLVDAAKEIIINNNKSIEGGNSSSSISSVTNNNSITRSFSDFIVNNKYATGGIIGNLPSFATGGIVGFDMPEMARIDFRIPNFTIPTMKIPQASAPAGSAADSKEILKRLDRLIKATENPTVISQKLGLRDLSVSLEKQTRLNQATRF